MKVVMLAQVLLLAVAAGGSAQVSDTHRVIPRALAMTPVPWGSPPAQVALAVLDEQGDVTIRSWTGQALARWRCEIPVTTWTRMTTLERAPLAASSDALLCISGGRGFAPGLQIVRAADGAVSWKGGGEDQDWGFGRSVCMFRNDVGESALLIGSPGQDDYFPGTLWSSSFADGAIHRVQLPPEAQNRGLGMSICAANEAASAESSGEGQRLFVGAPACDDSWRVDKGKLGVVVMLQGERYVRILQGDSACFGSSVCVLRSSNGAGKVLATSTSDDPNSPVASRVELFDLPGLEKSTAIAAEVTDQLGFGELLAAVPDVNRDGLEDLLVVTNSHPRSLKYIVHGPSTVAIYDGATGGKLCDVAIPVPESLYVIRDVKWLGGYLELDSRKNLALSLEVHLDFVESEFRIVIASLPET